MIHITNGMNLDQTNALEATFPFFSPQFYSPTSHSFHLSIHLYKINPKGDLDLYISGDGRWEISFKAIDCPNVGGSEGNIMMKFTGSNPWYIKLQARNTR